MPQGRFRVYRVWGVGFRIKRGLWSLGLRLLDLKFGVNNLERGLKLRVCNVCFAYSSSPADIRAQLEGMFYFDGLYRSCCEKRPCFSVGYRNP